MVTSAEDNSIKVWLFPSNDRLMYCRCGSLTLLMELQDYLEVERVTKDLPQEFDFMELSLLLL